MSGWRIRQAADAVQHGGIIAYPTEAVYGLGCNPYDAQAVARLLTIKQRDPMMGLILIADRLEAFEDFIAPLESLQRKLLMAGWPGPVTWLVPASPDCPVWLRGRHTSIAIRVTAHKQTRKLCKELGIPLVSTSANRHGHAAATTASQVRRTLGSELDFILTGPTDGLDRPSKIRDLSTGDVIRA